jgi:hypothetical protein
LKLRGPDVFPPRERRFPWVAAAVSLAAHLPLFLVVIGAWLPPLPPALPERVVLIPLGAEGNRAVEMVLDQQPAGGPAQREERTAGVSRLPRVETGPPEEPPPIEPAPDAPAVVARPSPVVAPEAGPAARGHGRIGPSLGDGKLWVRPLPLPPGELARAVTRSHAELVDSAVTAIVQVYIDSVLNAEPANAPLPSWVTRVGDQQIGIDSRWIYLGPIKIPTALLALLPINAGSAEMSDFTRYRQLQQMREDVRTAARRAETMSDFKRAIRELRAQRERERDFARNQRTPPGAKRDTTSAKPDIP